MPSNNEYPLSLIIKAVDQATGPLTRINDKLVAFNKPFANLSKQFKAFGENSGLSALGTSLSGLGSATMSVGREALGAATKLASMGAVAGFAFYEIVKHATEAGAELEHAAHRVGMTADAYAQLRFAAQQSGVGADEFASGMDRANRSLSQARDAAGPLYELLSKRAPVLAQQFKHAKNNAEGMKLLASAFRKETDEGRRAQIVQAAFGRGAKQMGDFLGQPVEKIEELEKLFAELAGPQDEYAKQSVELGKAMNEVGAAFDGLQATALAALAPALKDLSKTLAKLISQNRDKLKVWAETTGKAISDWVAGGGITRLGDSLKKLADTIGTVVDKLGGFQNAGMVAVGLMNGPLIGATLNWGLALTKVIYRLGKFGLLTALPAAATAMSTFVEALGLGFGPIEALQLALSPLAITAGVFSAAFLAVGVAGYEVYKNWIPLKELFGDIWYDIQQVLAFTQGGSMGKLRNLTGNYDAAPAFKGLPQSSMNDFNANLQPPLLGAAGVGVAGATSKAETTLTVNIGGLPKGSRVTTSGDDILTNLSYGPNSMVPQ